MSSRDLRGPSRRVVLAGLAATLATALGGCLRPLYGPTATGERLEEALASIRVEPVQVGDGAETLGHHLRQELAFALDGSGASTTSGPKRLRLVVSAGFATRVPITDATTLRASVASLQGDASWRLETIDGTRLLREGAVQSSVTYERTVQRFAAVRAARDAQIRLARGLSDQIRTQLAVALQAGVAAGA